MKRTALLLILLLGSAGLLFWLITRPDPKDNPTFICVYRPLKEIVPGLSKDQVIRVLGRANEEIDKSKTPHNFFREHLKKEIREGWIYEVKGWQGKIEVYYDHDGKVLSSNCGSG